MNKDLANDIRRLLRHSSTDHFSIDGDGDRVEVTFIFPKDKDQNITVEGTDKLDRRIRGGIAEANRRAERYGEDNPKD